MQELIIPISLSRYPESPRGAGTVSVHRPQALVQGIEWGRHRQELQQNNPFFQYNKIREL